MEHACFTLNTNLHGEGPHNNERNRIKNMQFSFFKKWVGIVCFLMAILLSSSVFAVDDLYVSGITGTNATANGIYVFNGTTISGSPAVSYNSWKYINGANTYYICHDNDGYWDICTNINDPINSFIYTSQDQSFIASPTGITNWCNNSALETLQCSLPISVKSSQPEINVLGNANTITDGSVSPSFSNYSKFSAANYTSGTVSRTFTINNTGLTPLVISGVTITGTNYGDFAITTSPASSVAASGSTTLAVQFDPSAIGSRTATITITNNDADEGTYDFSIAGNGYTPSNLVVYNISTPSAANGIYTHQGVLSGQYEYWRHTSGSYYIYRKAPDGLNYKWIIDSDTDVTTYLFTDYGISDFSPITDSWIASIGTGSPKVVSYVASPEIVVVGNATSIANNDVTPRTADHTHFGTAEVGTGSVTRTFTIQNAGGTNLQLTGSSPYIALSGTNASEFTVAVLPSTPITAGNSTTFQITFTPLGEGTKTATVSIANDDGDENPFTFAIKGGGVYAKGLTVSGTSTVNGDYTYQGINADGFASWVHTSGNYRIYNSQYVPLDRRDWRIDTDTDPDNGVCYASPEFNTDPAPIGITPWGVGIGYIGQPVIVYYSSEINIQGNGNSIANGDVTPITTDYTDFGSVLASSGNISHSFTIQNTGKGSLYLTGSPKVAVSGTNASDFTVTAQPTSPVAATTGTTTFTVLFDPSDKGVRTATISIVNDDSDENPYTFSIQGTGLAAPILTTEAVSGIGSTTATGNGTITDLGNPSSITAHGVCWKTSTGPVSTDSHTDGGVKSTTGAFTASMTGLSANTTYYVRAYATNAAGTSYGTEVSFTSSPIAPTVTTQAVSQIGMTTATGNGNVTSLGVPNPTAHGVCWKTSTGPVVTDSHTDGGAKSTTGAFTASMTGLSANTTYYVRAYATNTAGTSYGTEVSFTTLTAGTWTGNGNNSSWTDPANWAGGAVPTSATNVTLPMTGITYFPLILATETADCNNLTTDNGILEIISSASGTGSLIVHGTSTGNVICERYLTGNAWHMVSSPILNAPVSSFLSQNTTIPTRPDGTTRGMMDYNEPTNDWNALFTNSTTGDMGAGKGYAVRTTVDETVVFGGNTLNTGTINVAVARTGSNGWNLVGNPYSSAIAINTAAAATNNFINLNSSNLDGSFGAIYVWDEATSTNNYSIIRLEDATAFYAQVGQGFFIKEKVSGTQISFTPAMQTHQRTAAFKSAEVEWPEIKLVAKHEDATSTSTTISFNENMGPGLDFGYDAGAFKTGFDLYSTLVDDNGVDFGIQCLPLVENEELEIPIGLESTTEGAVSLYAEISGLPSECEATFEDRELGTFTTLAQSDSICTVQVAAGSKTVGRFFLHVKGQTSVIGVKSIADDWKIYTMKGQIGIAGLNGQATATIYDLQGRKLRTVVLQQGTMNSIPSSDFINGIYLLNINQQGVVVTKKIAVNN